MKVQKWHRHFHISLIAFIAALIFLFQNCSSNFSTLSEKVDFSSEGMLTATDPNGTTVQCDVPDQAATLLSQTCFGKLKENLNAGIRYANFIEFQPQYPLYSDGATKRRWLYLPKGKKINSGDLDNWSFPKGSILFKEFSMNGQVMETRQIEKIAEGDGFNQWRFTSYAQLADNSDAIPTQNGFNTQSEADLQNYMAYQVRGQYLVGTPNSCVRCHGSNLRDAVRGFNMLQLSSREIQYSLADAIDDKILTAQPIFFDEIPGSDIDKKAIGYIQGNCVSCHDGQVVAANFRHMSGVQKLEDENIIKRALTVPGFLTAKQKENSRIWTRFSTGQMPPVDLHVTVDSYFFEVLNDWIDSLEIAPPEN